MGRPMGLDFGLNGDGKFCKRKFRYLFRIDGVVADSQKSMKTLPPLQSARPNLNFKEMTANHLIEDVFYPSKPDWKPINLVLYDLKIDPHPVWEWIKKFYDPRPEKGILLAPNENPGPTEGFIRNAILDLYDGCGELVEQWVYEDAWPQAVNFQTLDMGSSEIVTLDLTIRYVRAYVQEAPPPQLQQPSVGSV